MLDDITIILPVHNLEKFRKYILINSNFFIKKKIYIYILSNKKIFYLKKNLFIKEIIRKKFNSPLEKIFYALKNIKTKYVFLLREDELLCELGFLHLYNQIKKNDKICSIQGLKFLVLNKKIHPHNPNNFNFQSKLEKLSIKEKFKNILNYAPECYWTIHNTKIIKKFFFLVIKKKYFCDPINHWGLTVQYFDYYFIFFLLIYGDIKFENMPINLKIKFRKENKIQKLPSFQTIKKNEFFLKNLEILAILMEKKRKIKREEAKKIILYALTKKLDLPKPRDIANSYNLFQKFIYRIKRKYKKMKEYFSDYQLISQNDVYYVSYLNRNLYNNLINNKKITKEIDYLIKNTIDPN